MSLQVKQPTENEQIPSSRNQPTKNVQIMLIMTYAF